jgi:large subunit ribosomal protein L6
VLNIKKENDTIIVSRLEDSKNTKALHGLFRTLLSNAVVGVEKPWERKLEVSGTGFNVKMQGEDLVFKVGYSHPVIFKKVPGISYTVTGTNKLTVKELINS